MYKDSFIQLIKQKGTGKTMSKALSANQCIEAESLLGHHDIADTSKVTLLVAFIMLKNTPEEQHWFDGYRTRYHKQLPESCWFLFDRKPAEMPIMTAIYKVLDHQNLSKDEMHEGLLSCLNPNTPNVYKAALLEGLRLKEETALENKTSLETLQNQIEVHRVNTPILLDIATAYDGFNRHPNFLLGIATLLAACHIPVLLHGCRDVSPKFGITFHKLLTAAGKNPLLSTEEVIKRLETPSISWGYLDQSVYFSKLHALRQCRSEMVKRPVLATVEKFLFPLRATNSTYCVTGYTHPAYRNKTRELLESCSNLAGFMFVRGIEGSCLAPLDRRCPLITQQESDSFASPEIFECQKSDAIQASPSISVNDSLTAIQRGLQEPESIEAEIMIYNALLILDTLPLTQSKFNKKALQAVIESGGAWDHWNNY